LLGPTRAGRERLGPPPFDVAVHLDRAGHGAPTHALLAGLRLTGAIVRNGVPAALQVGQRWVVERTHASMNGVGTLRRCTERRGLVVNLFRFLAAALIVTCCLPRETRTRDRWPT